MDIEITPRAGVTFVRLTGRIVDGEPEAALREAFNRLIQEDHKRFVLDLGGVTWFDSLAVGLLVCLYASATKRGGSVTLLRAPEKIRTLLQVARLEDRFGWASDPDEAERGLEVPS